MRTALLDGDVYLFQAALAAETVTDWDDGVWTLESHEPTAIESLTHMVERDLEATECADLVFALSDPDRSQIFRKQVLPTYKEARTKKRKPLLIPFLREWALDMYTCYEKPTLEGDDVLGILMTHPNIIKGTKVCISIDKDMKTVPGLHYNANRPDEGIYEVDPEFASRFHLQQTLAGDAVDGYGGCPGIGMDTAAKILDADPHIVEPYEHTFKSGKRAGETETRWAKVEGDYTPWQTIVSYYRKAGLGEQEALRQARCARILQHTDYDFTNKRVSLWTP